MMTQRDSDGANDPQPTRDDFAHFLPIATRWKDNDVYGHVNNVVYYSYFDTVVNKHLIEEAGLDIRQSPVIGVVVETQCEFLQELTFPETIDAGIAVERLGRSSVTYRIGLFRRAEDDNELAAVGRFVHVYVDRETRRPVSIPENIRNALRPLQDN
jgi:acyl-CoA thioester hydrolase